MMRKVFRIAFLQCQIVKENTIKRLAQKEILLKDSILIRSKAGRTRDMAEGNPFPAGEKNALNSTGANSNKKESIVARENYSYKKYQKELAQKKKREEKLQSKLAKKNVQANTDQEQALIN